ncbi:hypothetical protein [Gloeocapsa sp. PCC 73106]|uniref:hypothetical protein n=1 Tax=Gloeocapsa sp. PCC 73106 TaxID=102232 RepID=UPI0002AC0647|nr:hypothetical protein [Gloeocapsa sp. PCC 73106]ELR97835.1 hypothetical protein GLO73106DRAFT_00016520 [Gloeocapsa sp. PCC 73106]
MFDKVIDKLGDWNPQLFREAKGRLRTKNLIITGIVSILVQTGILFYQIARTDLDNLDQHKHLWSHWWLIIFLAMSVIGMLFLMVGGTYLLIEDLSQETKKGTLGFIRLTPQSHKTIILGKILGVPILIYWMMLLALPLQLITGVMAGIPLMLILGFDLIVTVSSFFFYSLSSLFGLFNSKASAGYAFIFPTLLSVYLLLWTLMTFSPYAGIMGSFFDWLGLFYPGKVLPYLVQAANLDSINYLKPKQLTDLSWYQFHLWRSPGLGMALIIANFGVWTYWVWQGLKRCFFNTQITLLSKNQSYWFSTTTMAIIFGFTLQTAEPKHLFHNFALVLVFHLLLILGLTFALTTQRQTLQDWARYRRQPLVKDLLFGERSPALLALSINALISGVIMLPGIILMFGTYTPVVILGLLSQAILLVIYGLVVQLILLRRSQRRGTWAKSALIALMVLPPVILALLGLLPHIHPEFWLFVPLSLYALNYAPFSQFILPVIIQGVIIALGSWTLTKQLQSLGESETKAIGY